MDMWRDAVKLALQRERTRWLDQHGGDDVAMLSVTQLVRLLVGGDAADLDDGRHIECHDISPQPRQTTRQSLKRPRTEQGNSSPAPPPPPANAVSFSSTRVWVTGFVRHEHEPNGPRRGHGALCLCDAAQRIRVHIVYPSLELLDGLVLVKSWTVLRFNGPEGARLVMEVHGDPTLLHQPRGCSRLTVAEALEIVRTNNNVSDPPLYTGWRTWESVLGTSPRQEAAGKKRKVHTVVGRLTSISPISVQEDASSSHYFVEIEDRGNGGARSIVNVLLAGVNAVAWYPFLWPCLMVLLTNLKKVYSSESEMFLLQASFNNSVREGNSSLLVWRTSNEIYSPASQLLDRQCDFAPGKVFDFDGVVTSIIWDECVMLDSEIPVVVALFHYPWSDIKQHLRVGARISVYQAHFLSWRIARGQRRLVVGLCARSHVRVIAHAPATSEATVHRPGDNRKRLHKKWSQFGDFGAQPLAVSMWWLDLLEVLVHKFRFSTDKSGIGSVAFTCLRRRAATLAIGQDAFSASSASRSKSPRTLAQRFLNTHGDGDDDCPSVIDGTVSFDFVNHTVLTLRDITFALESIAREKISHAVDQGESIEWPLEIEGHKLRGVCVLGALRGCNETSDMEFVDETASVPVFLSVEVTPTVNIDSGCAIYVMKNFDVIVESREVKSEVHAKDHGLEVSFRVSLRDMQRLSLCSNPSCRRVNESSETCQQGAVIVYVTYIGPWKRRVNLKRNLREFRQIQGIGFQCDNDEKSRVDWSSAHGVNMMMSAECEGWFIRKGAWFKFSGTRVNASAQPKGDDGNAELVQHWLKMNPKSSDATLTKPSEVTSRIPKKAFVMERAIPPDQGIKTVSYVMDLSGSVVHVVLSPTEPSQCLVEALHVRVSDDVRRCVASLEEFASKSHVVSQVRDLFVVERDEDGAEHTLMPMSGIGGDPHAARLINIVGVVKERRLYFKPTTPVKSAHNATSQSKACGSRMCQLTVRDLYSPESVFITLDTDAFGAMSALQPGIVVEISKLQCFIARATFKPYLTWTHCTTARRVVEMTADQVVSDSRVFSQIPTEHLNALYKSHRIDRTIKRFVIALAHLSYAVIKRRCSQCKQPLTLLKRQQSWVHANVLADDAGAFGHQRNCSWKQIALDAPAFEEKTFLSCSLRGIVDDGSAQAELFVENDVVWELLRCSRGQRQRFQDLLVRQTSELSYFATRSPAEALFTTPSMQENLYYQNEWRAFVQETTASSGPFVVFARRFYKAPSATAAPPTAVLSFGKDIQITTPSVPLPSLEAVRLDALHARQELRRRLAARPKLDLGRDAPRTPAEP